jgi:hypothetical protein
MGSMSKIQLIPCSYADFERFQPWHYWPEKPISKFAVCNRVLVDGIERGFVAAIFRRGKVHKAKAWLEHRTAVLLPRSHSDYLRLWAVASDAQAQQYGAKGLRFYSVAPTDHVLYRDKEGSGWKATSKDRERQKTGYRSHEYVGVTAVDARAEAMKRFKADPEKCFQRCLREVYGEIENKSKLTSLKNARVETVSNEDAAALIEKYEWLGTSATGTVASYGLKLNGELLGVVQFSKGGSVQALRAIHKDDVKVILLARGACVPHAPKNSATFLIMHACKIARKKFGWEYFLAYSDSEASETGQIYRACNWKSLGCAKQGVKTSFISPEGQTISSYMFNKKSEKKFIALGWDGHEGKYEFLRRLGWIEKTETPKNRWGWRHFEPEPN